MNADRKTSPTLRLVKLDSQGSSDLKSLLSVNRDLLIEVIKGPNAGWIYKLVSIVTVIGRKHADLSIDHETISTKHAVIEVLSRDNIYIRDLASTNGTYVDDIQIVKKKLGDGSVIRVGTVELKFFIHDFTTPAGRTDQG